MENGICRLKNTKHCFRVYLFHQHENDANFNISYKMTAHA